MNRRVFALAALGALLLGPGALRAQGPALQATVIIPRGAEEVWKLEGKRRAALIAGDLKTLDALVASDLTYTHSNGKIDTKESLFGALRSGTMKYEALDFLDASVRSYGETVVLTGVVEIAVKTPERPIRFRARFTDVWARQRRQWRFVAWQTTRLE